MDEYLSRFDLLRREVDFKTQTGGAFPGVPALALLMQNASQPLPETSLALASVEGNPGIFAAARQMGRLFGPRGGVARQVVPGAAAVDATSREDDYFALWVAYRQAERKANRKGKPAGRKTSKTR